MKDRFKWTIRLSSMTPVLLIFSVFAIGGGHGTFLPTIWLFPLAMIETIWQDTLSPLFFVLAILQYPSYGLIVDRAMTSRKRKISVWLLVFIHTILAIFIIKINGERWQ